MTLVCQNLTGMYDLSPIFLVIMLLHIPKSILETNKTSLAIHWYNKTRESNEFATVTLNNYLSILLSYYYFWLQDQCAQLGFTILVKEPSLKNKFKNPYWSTIIWKIRFWWICQNFVKLKKVEHCKCENSAMQCKNMTKIDQVYAI